MALALALAVVVRFTVHPTARSPVIALHFRFFETNTLGVFATFVASNTTSRDFDLRLYCEYNTNGVFTTYPAIPAMGYGVWSGGDHGFVRLPVPAGQLRFRAAADCTDRGPFAKVLAYLRQRSGRQMPAPVHSYSEELHTALTL
jgi:hypothetical protein